MSFMLLEVKFQGGEHVDKNFDKISKEIFDAYIFYDGDDRVLEEFSKKYDRRPLFLKQLMEDYLEYATPEEKEAYKDVRAKKKKNDCKYKREIDKLLSMTEEERVKYLTTGNVLKGNMTTWFKNYLKRFPSEEVVNLKNWVDDFYKKKSEKEKNDWFSKVQSIVDTYLVELVNNGYYTFDDYVNDFYMKYSIDKFSFNEKLKRTFEYLRLHVSDVYEYYKERMVLNQKMKYDSLKDLIDDYSKNISNLDVIDYYVIFHMPIRAFLKLCEKSEYRHLFNKYLSGYVEYEKNDVRSDEDVLNCRYDFSGVVPSDDDKLKALSFMKSNGIPNVYFDKVLKKYVNGLLSIKCK